MKKSKELREWQNDIVYLTQAYDLNPVGNLRSINDAFVLISQAMDMLSANSEKAIDQDTSEEISYFFKTTAESLHEFHNILRTMNSENRISIVDYYNILSRLDHIGELINKMILLINKIFEIKINKAQPRSEDFACWILN